ncbi:hypothetical protein ACF06T_30155 [Streptomyces albidoflavus]
MSRHLIQHARLRMLRTPGSIHLATVEDVEKRTNNNDARIALCIALGVDLADIDPTTGHNKSQAAYETSRTSWVRHIAMWGFSEHYDRPRLDKARASWSSWNPAYIEGDDWLAAGRKAHDDRQARLGQSCDRFSCDLHEPIEYVAPPQRADAPRDKKPAVAPESRPITDVRLPEQGQLDLFA